MSYILDALRRADADRERERGAVPGLHARPMAAALADARAGPPSAVWLAAGGALLVLLALLLWWALRPAPGGGPALAMAPGAAVTVPAPGTAAPPTAGATAQQPAQPTAPLATPPVRVDADPVRPVVVPGGTPTPAQAAPLPAAPVAIPPGNTRGAPPLRPNAAPGGTGTAGRADTAGPAGTSGLRPPAAQPEPARSQGQPATASAQRPPLAAATVGLVNGGQDAAGAPPVPRSSAVRPAPEPPAAAPRPMQLAELPAELRREMPPMSVGGSIYSDSAASRFVIVNGQVVREGESAAPGVVLERIGAKSAVLRWRDLRIEVPL